MIWLLIIFVSDAYQRNHTDHLHRWFEDWREAAEAASDTEEILGRGSTTIVQAENLKCPRCRAQW